MFASISLSVEGEFRRLFPPGNSCYDLDTTPNTCPRFSGASQSSWPRPQVCVEARGMSQALQALTNTHFSPEGPAQGHGLSGIRNVDT